jgi:hypothetical protein
MQSRIYAKQQELICKGAGAYMQRSRSLYAKEQGAYMQRSREPMQKEGSHLPPPRADNYGSQERGGGGVG